MSDVTSRFSSISEGEKIDAFAIIMAYLKDDSPDKWNLVIGGYRDDEGQPCVLPAVREIELQMSRRNESEAKEYLPALGSSKFRNLAAKLALGSECTAIIEKKVLSIQTLSGSGALRLGAEFLSKSLGYNTFYCSIPTYRNHKLLFKHGGFEESKEYRYWSDSTQTLNMNGFLEDLEQAPEDSVIILQVCVHNPTGHDPDRDDWIKIADVIEERRLFPFFDMAFQGLASGNVEEDASPVRYFASRGIELMCAQSFSKIFGLYNERIGNLLVFMNDAKILEQVESQFIQLIEGMYGSPPSHGALIMETIMGEMELFSKWKEAYVNVIRNRIIETRKILRTSLERLGTPGDWSALTEQIGMTTSSRLTETQVEHLAKKHHIYILSNGNFNICALNRKNVDRFAKAVHETVMIIK